MFGKRKKQVENDGVEASAEQTADAPVSDEKAAAERGSERKTSGEDDTILSGQLDDLRSELNSPLPEPEEFLSFEKVHVREGEDDEDAPGRFPNSPKWLVRFGIGATIVGVLAVAALVFFFLVEVPDVTGAPVVEASERLAALGLDFEIFEEEDPNVPAGHVISTTPAAGAQTIRGSTIVVRVSDAADQVAVPDLSGMTFEEAQGLLTTLRLTAEEVRTFDSTVSAGSIAGFLPVVGTQVAVGSTVKVLVSAGVVEVPIEVPSVIGLSEEVAYQALADSGFNPVIYHASTTFGEADEVVAQTPGGRNMVSPGSSVLVLVSTGSSTTDLPVPDIVDSPVIAAEAAIRDAGFSPERFNVIDTSVAAGAVISQMPPAEDTLLRTGERVGFLVSTGDVTTAGVPGVLALDAEAAADAIRAAGFNPVLVTAPDLVPGSGIIIQQFPAGGSQYHLGLPVLIYLSTQQ